MAELDKLGQSEGDEEVHGGGSDKKTILLSEPVKIVVTCLTPPTGAGRGPLFFPHQNWGYNERQRIKIPDFGDNYCMFHALVAARAYHDNLTILEQRRKSRKEKRSSIKESDDDDDTLDFHQSHKANDVPIIEDLFAHSELLKRLVGDPNRMRNAVNALMMEAGIQQGLGSYGVEQLPIVQDYWVVFIYLQNY